MKMVPDFPLATDSKAEKLIFDALKEAFHPNHEQFIALHSLKLPKHIFKRTSEIDFLICCPFGIYVLEVKGGRVQYDGQRWSFTHGDGHTDFSYESPFSQAESAMYSFKDLLKTKLTPQLLDKITFGYGVILPDCRLSNESLEWEPQLICQGGEFRSLQRWLEQLFHYWQAKEHVKEELILEEVYLLLDVLRPKQTADMTILPQVEWANKNINKYTKQQYVLLDAVEANPRVICSGSAGTGKTFMGMELARRWTSRDKKVLLLCRSLWLKHFLSSQFRLSNLTVSTLDGLTMAAHRAGIDSFDVLLIDEGQDLLSKGFLNQVEPYLSGGFSSGRWVFFHDINNQSGLFGKVDMYVFNNLSQHNIVNVPLNRNCRNTSNIIETIREYTGADMAVDVVGTGPDVKVVSVKDRADLITSLKLSIDEVFEFSGLSAAELTILTDMDPNDFLTSIGNFLQHKIVALDEYAMQHFPPSSISLTSVEAFKGLENTAVFLCLSTNYTEKEKELLFRYVGMSRAKVLLYMLFYDAIN